MRDLDDHELALADELAEITCECGHAPKGEHIFSIDDRPGGCIAHVPEDFTRCSCPRNPWEALAPGVERLMQSKAHDAVTEIFGSESYALRRGTDAGTGLRTVLHALSRDVPPRGTLIYALREGECGHCGHSVARHSLRNPPCDLCDCPHDRWEVTAETVRLLMAQDASVYDDVRLERERAHAKHGPRSMESWSIADPHRLSILLEEVGEVAREFNEASLAGRSIDLKSLWTELIQVAAMATAWADACKREKW